MVYRTTTKMAQRKTAHRRRLLDVAADLFGRHGYHATTVPMIVGAARSSTGSFYFYFSNKEDVFAAVLEEIGERIAAALNAAIEKKMDVFEQMREAVRALFLFMAHHPGDARVLILESSGLSLRLDKVRRRILASHARGVESALRFANDRLPPQNPTIASHCWVGAVYEASRRWLEASGEERVSVEEAAAEVASFNLRGIGAPKEYQRISERR